MLKWGGTSSLPTFVFQAKLGLRDFPQEYSVKSALYIGVTTKRFDAPLHSNSGGELHLWTTWS